MRSSRSARAPISSSKADGNAALPAALAARRRAKRLFSGREVDASLRRMAGELTPHLAGRNPVVLAVMHGGAFAAVELCRRFDFAHEFDYVHVESYRGEIGGELRWRKRPRRALAGRTVLIVDDILDRGRTLRALEHELDRIGVAKRFSAVLVRKRVANPGRRPKVDAFGLEVDDVYVFGSGMDYSGYWRSLNGVFALETHDD